MILDEIVADKREQLFRDKQKTDLTVMRTLAEEKLREEAAKKEDVYKRQVSDDSKEDEAGINNTVTVYIEEDDMEESFKLVTTMRGNSLKGLISIESPMGKAVLGHKVGDRVSVKVNDDYSYDVIIRKIENTGEENEKIRSF